MAAQFAEIEVCGEPASLYCPACGSAIYEEAQDPEKCRHVVFTYLDMVGEFDYVRDDWTEAVALAVEQAEEQERLPPEVLVDGLEAPSILCLSITSSGYAHGPMSVTLFIGIDFGAAAGSEELAAKD